jgi:amino acid transporter
VAAAPQAPEAIGGSWSTQRARLRRDFHRFDILFFLICTLVGLDTIGSVAANGPQGLAWMIILAVVFFVPYGLLVAELGTAFPFEGGPYVWTKLAFGRLIAGVNQVMYWISNPIWVGGTLCIIAITTFHVLLSAARDLEVRGRTGVHLGRGAGGAALVPGRQVGADAGRGCQGAAAGVLRGFGGGLRGAQRCAAVVVG